MTKPRRHTVNMSAQQQRLIIDRLILPFLKRAGITATVVPSDEAGSMLLRLRFDDTDAKPDPHGARLRRMHLSDRAQ